MNYLSLKKKSSTDDDVIRKLTGFNKERETELNEHSAIIFISLWSDFDKSYKGLPKKKNNMVTWTKENLPRENGYLMSMQVPMIVSASSSTNTPAFYADCFL